MGPQSRVGRRQIKQAATQDSTCAMASGGTSTSTELPFGGACLCGGVRFSISNNPVTSLICLCTQCQTIAGGFGVGSVIVPKESVAIDAGGDLLVDFEVPGSVKGVVRRFCKVCGTHIFAANPAYPVTAVHAGTLAEPGRFQPQVAIWCQSRVSGSLMRACVVVKPTPSGRPSCHSAAPLPPIAGRSSSI